MPIARKINGNNQRRNVFNLSFKPETPGNRMSKRDRIQTIMAQRFAVGQVHIKKNHYELNQTYH